MVGRGQTHKIFQSLEGWRAGFQDKIQNSPRPCPPRACETEAYQKVSLYDTSSINGHQNATVPERKERQDLH